MVETAWTPTFGSNITGSYKVGGWYDTADVPDIATDVNGDWIALTGLRGQDRSGRYGFYANVVQTLRAPDADGRNGVKAMVNAIVTDPRTNTLQGKVAVGLAWTGPIAARRRTRSASPSAPAAIIRAPPKARRPRLKPGRAPCRPPAGSMWPRSTTVSAPRPC